MIQINDTVYVMWCKSANSDDFVEQKATVINLPRGEGDMIQVRFEDGIENAINPYNPWFIGLKKYSDEDK